MISCVVAVAIIFIGTKTSKNEPAVASQNETIEPRVMISTSLQGTSEIDTDSDGLKDWEEVLWGLDSKKADTDGDGIDDKKEVELIQLKKADGVVPTVSSTTKKSTAPEGPPTLTDQLARQTFSKYINYKQMGVPITKEITQKLVEDVLATNLFNQNLPKFNSAHLKNIVESDEKSAFHDYGNNLWDIMVKNTPKNTVLENEYSIFQRAIEKDDERELKKLDPIITGYRNTVLDIISMPVPRNMVGKHLELINSMNTLLASIEDMRVYFTDSARGFAVLSYYTDKVSALKKALVGLVDILNKNGVEYVEGEGGYTLMYSI